MKCAGVVKERILVRDLDEDVPHDRSAVPDIPEELVLIVVDRENTVEQRRGDVLVGPGDLEGNALGKAEVRLKKSLRARE